MPPRLYTNPTVTMLIDVRLECLIGKEITVHGSFDDGKRVLGNVAISCSVCHSDTYSLSAGKVWISLFHPEYITVIPAKCIKYLFGGVCENGQIRAASNF